MGELGHACFPYIDDSFVISRTRSGCINALTDLSETLDELGFTIHREKSILKPSTEIVFLGFKIDSIKMTVSLTTKKVQKFRRAAHDVLFKDLSSCREIAGLIGLMIAYSPAVEFSAAHTKYLEIDKNKALKVFRGNFDALMWVSWKARQDIIWWLEHLVGFDMPIERSSPTMEIFTDASNDGWGAHCNGVATGGRWAPEELGEHINVLELRAVLLGLGSLCRVSNQHISVRTDNTTTMAYVKHMGGVKSPQCQNIAFLIWQWCELNNNWLTISHIPGVDNILADLKSREFKDNTEWELDQDIFDSICSKFGSPGVDLFASRLNAKCERYVSWGPDPGAWRINAFTFDWTDDLYYIFPPFSLVGRVLQRVLSTGTNAIIIAPRWAGQPWFATLTTQADRTLYFRKNHRNLTNPAASRNQDNVIKNTDLIASLFLKKL